MSNRRLQWVLDKTELQSPFQCGFRKQYSTKHQLIELENVMSFLDKQSTFVIALELEESYSIVWRRIILMKFNEWGFLGNKLRFVNNYLHDRSFQVRLGTTLWRLSPGEWSCTRRSLSTTLFIIAMNSVCGPCVNYCLFEDNYHTSGNYESGFNILQEKFNYLENREGNFGFKFSPEKTRCIVFTKKISWPEPNYNLHVKPIHNTDKNFLD